MDPKPIFGTVQSLLVSHKCRLQSSALYEDKGQMVFLLYIPSGSDPRQLEAEVRSRLEENITFPRLLLTWCKQALVYSLL